MDTGAYNSSPNFPSIQHGQMTDWGFQARMFVRSARNGTLATHSLNYAGYPFSSLAGFVSDNNARPVILVSPLAEHSRNLSADHRCSLLIQGKGEDAQATGRVTLICEASEFKADEAFLARYVRLQPSAERLLALGDFYLMRLVPMAVRFIAGFGSIRWINPADYAAPWSIEPEEEDRCIAMLEKADLPLLDAFRQANPDARCIGMDCDGLEFSSPPRLRLDLTEPAGSFDELLYQLSQSR
jgi:hypothetical protein